MCKIREVCVHLVVGWQKFRGEKEGGEADVSVHSTIENMGEQYGRLHERM